MNWSQTDEVSTSLVGYYSDFLKKKKTGALAIMSCMYSWGKEKKHTCTVSAKLQTKNN